MKMQTMQQAFNVLVSLPADHPFWNNQWMFTKAVFSNMSCQLTSVSKFDASFKELTTDLMDYIHTRTVAIELRNNDLMRRLQNKPRLLECPDCGSLLTTFNMDQQHTNSHWNEYYVFHCGRRDHWSPNYRDYSYHGSGHRICPKSEAAKVVAKDSFEASLKNSLKNTKLYKDEVAVTLSRVNQDNEP